MAFDPATFRVAFPEFGNVTDYPDAMLNYWGSIATLMLNADRWAGLLDHGLSLYVAHNLVLARSNVRQAGVGQVPGGTSGVTSSKAVGSANVSYDTATSAELDAGQWNLTSYGKQFIRLARMIGAGGVQL